MLPNLSSCYLTKRLFAVRVSQCHSSAGDRMWDAASIYNRRYSSSLWFYTYIGIRNNCYSCESKHDLLLCRLPLWDAYLRTSLGILYHICFCPHIWLAFLFLLHPRKDTTLLLDRYHTNQFSLCTCLFYQCCSNLCIFDTHHLKQ